MRTDVPQHPHYHGQPPMQSKPLFVILLLIYLLIPYLYLFALYIQL
jgi:hypothetical protein